VKSIVGNNRAFAALKEDRSVVVWGHRDNGGDAGEKQSDLADIICLAKAEKAFAAQQASGKEIVWGDEEYHESALQNLHEVVTY